MIVYSVPTDLLAITDIYLLDSEYGDFSSTSTTIITSKQETEFTSEYDGETIVFHITATDVTSMKGIGFYSGLTLVAVENYTIDTSKLTSVNLTINTMEITATITFSVDSEIFEAYTEVDYSDHSNVYPLTHEDLLTEKVYVSSSDIIDVEKEPYYICSDAMSILKEKDSLLRFSGKYLRGGINNQAEYGVLLTNMSISLPSDYTYVADTNLFSFFIPDKTNVDGEVISILMAKNENDYYTIVASANNLSSSSSITVNWDYEDTYNDSTCSIDDIVVRYPYIRIEDTIYYATYSSDSETGSRSLDISLIGTFTNNFHFAVDIEDGTSYILLDDYSYIPSSLEVINPLITKSTYYFSSASVVNISATTGTFRVANSSRSFRYTPDYELVVSPYAMIVVYTNKYADLFYCEMEDDELVLNYKEIGIPFSDGSSVYFKGLETFSRGGSGVTPYTISDSIIGCIRGNVFYLDSENKLIKSI